MEYLVTMTTLVPEGVLEDDVADVRAREAVRTHQLALKGHVLRLWRPPLKAGEWRTIGLFAADDRADLEQSLASMPLRIWRTDEVTSLGPHPNDPGPRRTAAHLGSTEFLTTFTVTAPAGTSSASVDAAVAQEAERARELAHEGALVRLWALPGHDRSLGLWQAPDGQALQGILRSLPMAGWLAVESTELTQHPNDPVRLPSEEPHLTGVGVPPRAGRSTS
jgi:muconolactone delta-isomerase